MAERENKVRDRAYALWQAEGEPHGRDRDHWTQAELELGDDLRAEQKLVWKEALVLLLVLAVAAVRIFLF